MNTINRDINRELDTLIDRYFEGETTLAEEKRLRLLLATSASREPKVEEARAVMGIFAMARRQSGFAAIPGKSAGMVKAAVSPKTESANVKAAARRKRGAVWSTIAAAASIAVLLGFAFVLSNIGKSGEGNVRTAHEIGQRHSDTINLMAEIARGGHVSGTRSLAVVNRAETDDEVAAVLKLELGYMAEAERSVDKAVEDEFNSFSSLLE